MVADPGRPIWRFRLLAVLAGALLPLAFAPLDLLPLAFISPAMLFWLWCQASRREAAIAGFLFGLGQFGVGVSWIYVAIHDVGGSPVWLAAGMTGLLVIYLSFYPALAGWLAVRWRGRLSEPWWLAGMIPALWVLTEWLRGWILTGFTWLQLGYSQIDLPLAGLASWLGVYGVSWAVALSSGLLVLLVRHSGTVRMAAGAGLVVVWSMAWLAGQMAWSSPVGREIRVALIQGNTPQSTKWDPDQIRMRQDLYLRLTREHWDRDLVVWPENALTTFYHNLEAEYLQPLAAEARAHDTDIVFGVPVMDTATGRYYSSIAVIGAAPGIYHKRHLVPFGEYVPFESLLRGLAGFFDLPMSGFSRGSDDQPVLFAAGQPVAPSVCYEDTFSEEVIDFLPRATLLINGSNNGWYGDSFAPPQHLQMSRMRAAETARPLLRATTSGISAIVNHRGGLVSRTPQFETAVLTGVVQPRQGATLYVRVGNSLVIGLALLLAVGSGWRARHARR
ncbi:MAG TPA: apolipoprotein N-acyltransferase, partial [Chromatiales bacterium]|nr:apolipoprotein N-acyltransferase [Chromatiales bacterium]